MIIAVPTGIKIFSWLLYSFSKNKKMANNLFNTIFYGNKVMSIEDTNLLTRFPRSSRNYLPPNLECKELVIYGTNLICTVKYPYYTKIVRYMIDIPNSIKYALVGIMLSGGNITVNNKSVYKVGGIFRFKQAIAKF